MLFYVIVIAITAVQPLLYYHRLFSHLGYKCV